MTPLNLFFIPTRLLILTLLPLTSAFSAWADGSPSRNSFEVNPTVNVGETLTTIEIFNSYDHPISCRGTAHTQLESGRLMSHRIVMNPIWIGTTGIYYLHTSPADPFTQASTRAFCRYLN